MLTIKTLQQRLIIFLILPVAVFLTAIGVGGYFYIRGSLYQEWRESAILRLERAAHYMDMRLNEPRQWIEALANTGGDRQGTDNQNWILKKLREQPGVSRVSLEWQEPPGRAGMVQEGGRPGPPGRQGRTVPVFLSPGSQNRGPDVHAAGWGGTSPGASGGVDKTGLSDGGGARRRVATHLHGLSGE